MKQRIVIVASIAAMAAVHSAETKVTAAVGGTEAELKAAAARTPPAVPAESRVLPLESLLGGSPRAVRAAKEEAGKRRAAALAAQAKAAAERLKEKAAELPFPLEWDNGPEGRVRVTGIDELGTPILMTEYSYAQAAQVGTTDLWPGGATGYNLTGATRSIGLWEFAGVPRTAHQEFALPGGGSRIEIQSGQSSPVSNHATNVAGVLAAGGLVLNPNNGSDTSSGMAFGSVIKAWDYNGTNDDLLEFAALPVDSLQTSNHSYGRVVGWTQTPVPVGSLFAKTWFGDLAFSTAEAHWFGRYEGASADVDSNSRLKEWTLPVWSAGNDRGEGPATYSSARYVRVRRGTTNQGDTYVRAYLNGVLGLYNGSRFWAETTSGSWSSNSTLLIYSLPNSATFTSLTGTVGNDGGTAGYDSVPEGRGTAKNILTVGALTPSNVPATFSVFGPADDGRIKPDVMAGGTDAFMPNGNADNAYVIGAGTSFSSPSVAGSVALLAELQESLWGNKDPLRASTYRGLVIHTAADLGTTGPDYSNGWGRANFASAADLIFLNEGSDQRTYLKEIVLADGQEAEFTVKAAGGGFPVKATAAWTDPAGTPQANTLDPSTAALTNNLDLRIYRVSDNTEYKPWTLNPASPSTAATKGQNDRDNVEQVVTTTASAGALYRVVVKQKAGTTLVDDNGAAGSQAVSVVLSGVVNRDIPFSVTGFTFSFSGGNVTAHLTWGSHAGEYYKIEYSTDLQNWTECAATFNAKVDSTSGSSDPVPASPGKFFRVKTVSPNPFGY